MNFKLTALVAAMTLVAGCGSSTSNSVANGGNTSGAGPGSGTGTGGGSGGGTTNPPVQGIATPSSIAVVTANNAN